MHLKKQFRKIKKKKRKLLPRNIRNLRKLIPSRKDQKISLSMNLMNINQPRRTKSQRKISTRNHQKANPKRTSQRALNQRVSMQRKLMTISIQNDLNKSLKIKY